LGLCGSHSDFVGSFIYIDFLSARDIRNSLPGSSPQVHMLNGGCNVWSARHPLPGPDEIFSQLDTVGFNTTALSPRAAAAQEYARAAFEELSYALRSGGRFDTRELRGNLVLLGDEIDAWGLPTMYVFQRSFGDEFLLRKWQHASERDALITAAILAAIFGLVCGLGATYLVLRVFHFIAREIYRTKRRQALLQVWHILLPCAAVAACTSDVRSHPLSSRLRILRPHP